MRRPVEDPLDRNESKLPGPFKPITTVDRHAIESNINLNCFGLRRDDNTELEFRETGATLYSSISPLRYSEPFFYGRFRNMVLIDAFRPNPGLRFTQSPSGGVGTNQGDDTNPAWDFQLIVPRVQVGKEYKLEGCLIYKPWLGRDDGLAEVRKYRESLEQ